MALIALLFSSAQLFSPVSRGSLSTGASGAVSSADHSSGAFRHGQSGTIHRIVIQQKRNMEPVPGEGNCSIPHGCLQRIPGFGGLSVYQKLVVKGVMPAAIKG